MSEGSSSHVGATLSLPESTPGTVHLGDCKVEFDDGRRWTVRGDTETKLAAVTDESGQSLGWLEAAEKGVRQVVLPGGGRPGVSFQKNLFSRTVLIGDTSFKAVMMLEGRKRVFGDDRIKLEHRDFHNEVRIKCLPDLAVAAVLVAFEVYARPAMGNAGK